MDKQIPDTSPQIISTQQNTQCSLDNDYYNQKFRQGDSRQVIIPALKACIDLITCLNNLEDGDNYVADPSQYGLL